jgi:hypothetical protein
LTGDQSWFTKIDWKVHGTIHFGDGTVANIEGRGMILLKCKTGVHKLLVDVYLISRLTSNTVMHVCFLKIWDHHGRVVAKVKIAVNKLCVIWLDIDRPVCLAAQGDSPAWHWHARFGRLNFYGLWRLAIGEMVKGLP